MNAEPGFVPRQIEHPNSPVGAVIHLLKCSLGAGILAMPNAFKNGGLIFASIGTFIIGCICSYSVYLLVKVSEEICIEIREPCLDFSETSEAAFKYGPEKLRKFSGAARWTVDIALVVTYFMCNSVYVIFVADSFLELQQHFYPDWSLTKIHFILMIMGGLLITGQVRELKYLVPFSFCANVLLVIAFLILLWYMFGESLNVSDKKLFFGDFESVSVFVCTVIFAMEGIGAVMPVENTMANPQYFLGIPGVLCVSMTTVVVLYSTIGVFGYLKYGDDTEASISYNLPIDEVPAQLVKLFIALAIFFTYSLTMYIAVDILWRKCFSQYATTTCKTNVLQISMRCTFVVGTVVLAISVPDLENIIGLVGAVCFSTLGLLIPSVVDTVWRWDNLGRCNWILIKNIMIALLSLFALITGSMRSIRLLINDIKMNKLQF